MAKVASSQWLSESMRPFPFQCFIISLDKGYVPEKLWKLYIIDKKSISQLEDYTYRAISRNGGKSKRTDGAMKCIWQEMSRRLHSKLRPVIVLLTNDVTPLTPVAARRSNR